MDRQIANRLLAVSKRIWVRMEPINSNPHKGIGVLVGVEGRSGIVIPANRHRQKEYMPLERISLWKSRHPQLVELAEEGPEPMFANTPEVITPPSSVPSALSEPSLPSVTLPPSAPPVPSAASASPTTPILSQIQAIMEMKQGLEEEARQRIEELTAENDELKSLILANETELAQIRQFLNAPIKMPVTTTVRVSIDTQILDYLKQRATWTRAEDIRAALGLTMGISITMNKLLDEGRVVCMGEKRGRAYRVA